MLLLICWTLLYHQFSQNPLNNLFLFFSGCVIFLSQFIRQIPIAVLFGVFLYLGIISLFSGIQFMEQLRLFFTPRKYHPNKRYIYMVSMISCSVCFRPVKHTHLDKFIFDLLQTGTPEKGRVRAPLLLFSKRGKRARMPH